MKTLNLLAIVCFIVIGSNISSAQYGYGNNGMYGGGMNRMGNQQSMQNTNNYGRNTKSADDIEKERAKNFETMMDKLKTDLSLDDLQIIVIRKELEESTKKINLIVKSESAEEDKIKEVEAINEKTDRTINTYLSDEQKIKYKKFIEERKERIQKLKDRRMRN